MKDKVAVAALVWAALLGCSGGQAQAKEDAEDYYDYGEQPQNCSVLQTITGGTVSYSLGGAPGSVLTYHCRTGYYPFPVSQRVCDAEGEWTTMRLQSGRRVDQAICKEVMCPAQIQLDNGDFWPRQQWFRPGEMQEFSCHNGFTLYGSAQRNCTVWGQWTGTTPVCDDQVDDCMDPGTPPGALRSGNRFRIGEKVQYHCQTGLELLGSAERVCLDTQVWSGSETHCMAQFTFDSPDMVAQAIGGSFSNIFEVSSPSLKKRVSFARTINVAIGNLNIYILLDTSGSIDKDNFEKAKDATIRLIEKLDSYEVNMKFHVISYATKPKEILSIRDHFSRSADQAVARLRNFYYKDAQESGLSTNLHSALYNVYENMGFIKRDSRNKFNETQHVILIITDGFVNMGPDPKKALTNIRSLLGIPTNTPDHTSENLLDIYVFGVGSTVNKKQINAIASKKRKEKHVFILENYQNLGLVFDSMISDSGVTMCGIAKEHFDSGTQSNTRPWQVDVLMTSLKMENCKGSVLTPNWILTAAHCFPKSIMNHSEKVDIHHGNGRVKASSVILHPLYNINGLKHKNVKGFYDYDVALVKVNESMKLSDKVRPICLPCTKQSNRALKMNPNATCEQHEKALLPLDQTLAFFLTTKLPGHQQTHIHLRSKRPDCIKHAATILSPNATASMQEIVTDRFMCTGGSKQYQDRLTCKGDSGGALFLQERKRYFQVGVVSWGTKDVCKQTYLRNSPPEDARDFHISVFSVLPWLKQHLGQELNFLPVNN